MRPTSVATILVSPLGISLGVSGTLHVSRSFRFRVVGGGVENAGPGEAVADCLRMGILYDGPARWVLAYENIDGYKTVAVIRAGDKRKMGRYKDWDGVIGGLKMILSDPDERIPLNA